MHLRILSLDIEFEPPVPVPVVALQSAVIDMDDIFSSGYNHGYIPTILLWGFSRVMDYTITNHNLITALNSQWSLQSLYRKATRSSARSRPSGGHS